MTDPDVMLPVLRSVAAARAQREGRAMVIARSPSCWTVHPVGETRPGYEAIETIGGEMGVCKKIATARQFGDRRVSPVAERDERIARKAARSPGDGPPSVGTEDSTSDAPAGRTDRQKSLFKED